MSQARGSKRIGLNPMDWLDRLLDEESVAFFNNPSVEGQHSSQDVYTGVGRISGKVIAFYAHNPAFDRGFIGPNGSRRILEIMDKAYELGVPIVSLVASPGISIEAGVVGGDEYTKIIERNVRYSGVIPQISIVVGTSMGAPAYSATLTDIVVFNKARSHLMVTGPAVINKMLAEEVKLKDLGNSEVHSTMTGIADFVCKDIAAQLDRARELVEILPANYAESPKRRRARNPNRELPDIPAKVREPFDIREFIHGFVDGSYFLEYKESYGPSLLCGFSFIGGFAVAILANQPMENAGAIDRDAAQKASRFLKLCDAYNLTIVNLIDVPGFMPGKEQEQTGLLREGAKFCEAMQTTVPKVSIVLRRCYGAAAFLMMQTRSQHGDLVLATEEARIGVMGYAGAREIIGFEGTEEQYYAQYEDPRNCLRLGIIDKIVAKDDIRDELLRHLEYLELKKWNERPLKKHQISP